MAHRILRHGAFHLYTRVKRGSAVMPRIWRNSPPTMRRISASARSQHLLILRAPEKAADQGAVRGSAVKEFVVHESRGQHAFALAARDQESEAKGQASADLFP